MKEFHYYLPWRILDREAHLSYTANQWSIGFGSKSIILGKWYIALEGIR